MHCFANAIPNGKDSDKICYFQIKKTSGDGIVARATKGVAAQNSFQGKPTTAEWAVAAYGFGGILRTGGSIAASWRGEGRYAVAVEGNEGKHYTRQQAF